VTIPDRGALRFRSGSKAENEHETSALPPKADNEQTWRHVRFVPKADIRIAADLLDYFVGRSEQPRNGTQSLGLCDRDGNPDFTIIARGSGVQRENLISADIGRNCLLRRRLRLFRQVRIPRPARR
jgi:hypothetical protein